MKLIFLHNRIIESKNIQRHRKEVQRIAKEKGYSFPFHDFWKMINVFLFGDKIATKLCTKCGVWHDEIHVWDRTFKCECGVEMDRDVHAAKNMVWFYENNVGVERTKVKRMEMKALVDQALAKENQLLSAKYEDSSL